MPIIVPDPDPTPPVVSLTNEIRINRKNTTYFIRCNPYPVVLIPRLRTKLGTGGTSWVEQSPRPSQIMRLIPAQETTQPSFIDEGKERVIDFVLLGDWSAGMAINDQWRDTAGFLYEVVDIASNAYEIKGAVIKHGNR